MFKRPIRGHGSIHEVFVVTSVCQLLAMQCQAVLLCSGRLFSWQSGCAAG